jgi:hypothetical protein
VNPELARWLVSPSAVPALAAALAEPDPESLAAAGRLRRDYAPDQAAAVLTQARLRRRAVAKFGDRAATMFFTVDGLEQATRAEVAAWRAARFVEAGVSRVVDIGCGLGADAAAFAAAELEVIAIEADPVTAILAEANLAGTVTVVCGDATGLTDPSAAEVLAAELAVPGTAVFLDPARRTAAGRTWRVADFSPPWDFATGLLDGRFGCIKAAPGLPSTFIPEGFGATWVSHRGDLVETALWSSGAHEAVLLPSGARLVADGPPAPVGLVGRFLFEPNPAVIRSGALGVLADQLKAHRPAGGIGYLFAEEFTATAFAQAFEVIEVLPYDERTLRAWVRANDIGVVEIKCRGIELDPAALRRRLKPKGAGSATFVLTPTPGGARALVVQRL